MSQKKHKLDFSGKPFKLEELQKALATAREGQLTLVLRSSELRWADCGKIVEILEVFPALRLLSLDVSNNAIGPEGAAAFCRSRQVRDHLLDLNMADCLIEADGAAAVGAALRESHMTRLDLSGNLIGSYGVGAFAKCGLEGNVSLQTLVLDRNKIDDAGVVAMTSGLSFHLSLSDLSLSENAISARGAAALAEALSCDEQRIQRLNISHNVIGKKGAFEIAAMLAGNKSLLRLDVSHNTLSGSQMDSVLVLSKEQDGIAALGESLKKNRSLLWLNLSGNSLSVSATVGMKAMAGALAVNTTLCHLLLDSTDCIDVLEYGLKKNNSITSLGCEVAKDIASHLSRNEKNRVAFETALKKSVALPKVKEFVDKGVDIFGTEPQFLLKNSSPELTAYYHTLVHVRNHLYSTTKTLDELFSYPPKTLKELARLPTCLMFAVRMRHLDGVTSMLKHGADPNQPDEVDRTALHLAVELGYEDVIAQLFLYRANPDLSYAGMPLLALAASNGQAGALQFLVKKLPKMLHVCTPPPKSRSLLHVAAKSGRAQVVAVLLLMGLDANKPSGDGLVPLHVAASPEVCKILVDAGANIRALAPDGKDVLYYHLFPPKGGVVSLDVASFLLEHDADGFFFEPRQDQDPTLLQVAELDVRNLYRDNLPVWLGKLPQLETLLAVDGNGLRSVPKNAVEGGDEGMLLYLKDIAVGSKDVWQGFKILVLGKEGVGKTHIFHLASGGIYQRNVSTDGIDIHRFALSKEKVPVTWFDFGGQEVFYPTHELFLTGQCVYLLAFNMDDVEFEQRVSYWLRVVHSFSHDKAKVIIVGTHKDTLANGDADVARINTRICEMTSSNTEVVDKIYMSCLDDPKKMGLLIGNALMAAAQQAKLGGKEVPHIYTVINEWVADQRSRENARPYYLWDEFLEHFPGYDGALLERACDFLHDMGSLFIAKRFVRDKKANLICIDIQWLARAFSAVITFRHNWIKNGVLHQTALGHIWRDFGIVDQHDIMAIMSLFEKFNIAFSRRQEGVWVIPSMLNVEPPDAILNISEELTHARLYRMSVLPSGVFGQIIARVSDWAGVEMSEIWRYGMIVRDGRDMVCMTVEGGCEIHLLVFAIPKEEGAEGEEPKKFAPTESLLRRIDEELQAAFRLAFRSMEKLPVEISIMCPHCIANGVGQEACNWLSYESVVKLVLSGSLTFECDGEETSLAALGEDVTMGYAKSFSSTEIKVDSHPLVRGDSGAIYKGLLLNGSNSKVVVKELTVDDNTEVMTWFGTFQREVSQMMRLRHPNLVQMHGIMLGPLRMVLEFCGDGDLQGVLKRRKVKGKAIKMRLALDIAKGMHFLHSLDPPLAHRELRSTNVLLMSCNAASKDSVAKVKLAESGVTKAALTSEANTWQWMAPEAMFGQTPPETCDLYSYAMVLWEIWQGTGEAPFESVIRENSNKKPEEFMHAIAQEDFRPDLSSTWDVRELIVFLWEKSVQLRPSFEACIELLSAMQAGTVTDLGERLRRDKAAKAAASTVATISSRGGGEEGGAERGEDENPLRRLSRMTISGNNTRPTLMPAQAMPCRNGRNCNVMGCKLDHGGPRSETLVAESMVDDIFATHDSFEMSFSMPPPVLQVPLVRNSGGFKSGWEEEILQRAAAAKKEAEAAAAKPDIVEEPSALTFGLGWEQEILKRAAARKAAEESKTKAAAAAPEQQNPRPTFVKARPSRSASDAREERNSPRGSPRGSPRENEPEETSPKPEAKEEAKGGKMGKFFKGRTNRSGSDVDRTTQISPQPSPRREDETRPAPSKPRVIAPTVDKSLPQPVAEAPAEGEGRVRNRSSVVRVAAGSLAVPVFRSESSSKSLPEPAMLEARKARTIVPGDPQSVSPRAGSVSPRVDAARRSRLAASGEMDDLSSSSGLSASAGRVPPPLPQKALPTPGGAKPLPRPVQELPSVLQRGKRGSMAPGSPAPTPSSLRPRPALPAEPEPEPDGDYE